MKTCFYCHFIYNFLNFTYSLISAGEQFLFLSVIPISMWLQSPHIVLHIILNTFPKGWQGEFVL